MKVYPAKFREKNLIIIMPIYNEEAVAKEVVIDWLKIAEQYSGVLTVINDGSKDGTLEVLLELYQKFNRLEIIDKKNQGHGQTCIMGYKYAIENDFEWIFQTDSDGQTFIGDFHQFWKMKKNSNFLFGHRKSRGDGLIRIIISKTLILITYLTTGVTINDSNVPFRLMKSSKLKPYLPKVQQDVFLANSFLAILIQKYENIKWLPIRFGSRLGGIPSVSLPRFTTLGLKITKELVGFRKYLAE